MKAFDFPDIGSDPKVASERATLERVKLQLNEASKRYDDAVNGATPMVGLDRAVDAALAGRELPDTSLTDDLDKLAASVRILSVAVERQRRIVAEAERQVSLRTAEQAKPKYAALVEQGAKAIAALREFLAAEQQFHDAMRGAGVQFYTATIRPMGLVKLGVADCDAWAAEAKQHFNITA